MTELLSKVTGLEPEELKPAGLAAGFIFCLLAGYYVVRPLRDEIVLLLGKEYVPKLFIWTLLVMTVANPLFAYLLNRFDRISFIKVVYRFFALNILFFIGIFKYLEATGQMPEGGKAELVTGEAFWVCAVFFVWVSVFNLFAMSIFWALMADLYDPKRSKKVFGLVGAGGTLGQIVGSGLTKTAVDFLGPTNLLFLTVLLLEMSVFIMVRLTHDYKEPPKKEHEKKAGPLSGIADILRSPYLLAICLYFFCYSFTSSFIWFQKQYIVDGALALRETRVDFFATIDLVVGALTLIVQLFFTGRLIAFVGLAVGLSLVPVVTGLGFLLLAFKPGLIAIAAVEVCRRVANYGVSRPAREMLYTVVSRREKYLSKNFIDTFVYRGGDAVASGAFTLITTYVGALRSVSLLALPVAGLYLLVSAYLGKTHKVKAERLEEIQAQPERGGQSGDSSKGQTEL